MARLTVTESELADAIRDALATGSNPDDSFTIHEFARALEVAEPRARRMLHALQREGRLQVVRKSATSLDGRPIMVPAYRILRA